MLSRRDFLRNLAASAAVLSLEPFAGISTVGDIYRNERLGLKLVKPAGWEFSSIADFSALRDQQVLVDALKGESHQLRDPGNLPAFLFENSLYRQGILVPAIALYDEPLRGPTPTDPIKAHRKMLAGLKRSYREFSVSAEPIVMNLSGTEATTATFRYLHEIDDGISHTLSVQSILVFQEPRVHTFYLVDSAIAPRIEAIVWEKFIESITYQARLPVG